jgi:hypothetical protein
MQTWGAAAHQEDGVLASKAKVPAQLMHNEPVGWHAKYAFNDVQTCDALLTGKMVSLGPKPKRLIKSCTAFQTTWGANYNRCNNATQLLTRKMVRLVSKPKHLSKSCTGLAANDVPAPELVLCASSPG